MSGGLGGARSPRLRSDAPDARLVSTSAFTVPNDGSSDGFESPTEVPRSRTPDRRALPVEEASTAAAAAPEEDDFSTASLPAESRGDRGDSADTVIILMVLSALISMPGTDEEAAADDTGGKGPMDGGVLGLDGGVSADGFATASLSISRISGRSRAASGEMEVASGLRVASS